MNHGDKETWGLVLIPQDCTEIGRATSLDWHSARVRLPLSPFPVYKSAVFVVDALRRTWGVLDGSSFRANHRGPRPRRSVGGTEWANIQCGIKSLGLLRL